MGIQQGLSDKKNKRAPVFVLLAGLADSYLFPVWNMSVNDLDFGSKHDG